MSGKEYTDLNGNSGKEYMNSVVALGTLSKKDFEKYKILIMEKFVELLSRQEFGSGDSDSLDIIKSLLDISNEVSNVASLRSKSVLDANARSFDGNHLARISKIKHEDKSSDSISDTQSIQSAGKVDKKTNKKKIKSPLMTSEDKDFELEAAHGNAEEFNKECLRRKNSWSDNLKTKYMPDILGFLESSYEEFDCEVDSADFRNIDFGDYHGRVKSRNQGANEPGYRWDKEPKQAIVYFFTMILKGKNLQGKSLDFKVPAVNDKKEVTIKISKKKMEKEIDDLKQRNATGIVQDDSDDESVQSSARKKELSDKSEGIVTSSNTSVNSSSKGFFEGE